jgi:hypothetical protein
MKHAPSALEYICSIGMRRVLAEVPKTFPYMVCSAIIKLVELLDTSKTELNVMLLRKMVPSYYESLQGYFDYLLPLLETNQDPTKSYFLNHNGTTNMIAPLWHLVETGKANYVARILRALYTYEVYQAVRRRSKHKGEDFAQAQLDALLGVDFATRGTPLPAPFSRPDVSVHCTEVHLDKALFAEICSSFGYVKYTTLIVPFFNAIRESDPVTAVRAIPTASDGTIVKALELDYPLEEFLLYNIVEGFLYPTKQSRIDKDTKLPLRPDLGNRDAGSAMVEAYLRERYKQDYERRLRQMNGDERATLEEELVEKMIATESAVEFCRLFSTGIRRGDVSVKIANSTSPGCEDLHSALMGKDVEVPARVEKLEVFYTTEDAEGQIVWNNGSMYRNQQKQLENLLAGLGAGLVWEKIKRLYNERMCHRYRGGYEERNRQGHSNDLPSYFAFGHDSLESYFATLCRAEREAYVQKHAGCCGVAALRWNPTHQFQPQQRGRAA